MTFHRLHAGEPMLAVDDAQQRVLAEVPILEAETIALDDALGRVLREDIRAPFDVPEGDNTAMDGYAVRADDVATAADESPVTLRVVDDVPAGSIARECVDRGTAIRIMTGALMPDGADAVAQVEITDAGSVDVAVFRSVARGANVRRRGEDMHAGDVVIESGSPIHAAELAVLASVQKVRVAVGRRPTVAILSTGDELVGIDERRTPGKVVNSNAWALAALVREAGAVPRSLGIVRDTREATIAAIESALECDFVLSSGGVSVGAYDFVKDALDALGAETKFWQVAMKPGKPVVLSRLRGRLYFGLPGNPVSSMVSFLLFVAPSIRKAQGQSKNVLPPVVQARVMKALNGAGERRAYSRVRVVARDGELVAYPMATQGSGTLTSMLEANGLAIVEPGVARIDAGEIAPTVMVGPLFAE